MGENIKTTKPARLYNITYVRVVVTLFVILFHAYAMYFYSNLDHGWTDIPYIASYKIFFIVEELVQMPLFTFISGFLFGVLYNQGRYTSFKVFLSKKVQRLIVPYILGAIFYSLVSPFSDGLITLNWFKTIGHLWFLPMLFWCFVFQYLLRNTNYLVVIILAIFMELIKRQIPNFFCIMGLFHFFVYFSISFYIGKGVVKMPRNNLLLMVIAIVGSFLAIIFDEALKDNTDCYISQITPIVWNYNALTKLMAHLVLTLTSLSFCVLIINFSKKIIAPPNYLFSRLDRTSLGMYIVHLPIMGFISNLSIVRTYAGEHYVLYPIFMFLFIYIVSYAFVELLLLSKLGRKIL